MSADYVHDEALKILQSMASNELDDDGDEGSATPKPSMLTAQPAVGSEDVEDVSTFRSDIELALDGSRTSIRETMEGLDESLIEDRNNATPTDSEGEQERPDSPSPETRLSLVPEASRPLSLRSTVDGMLWDPESPEMASLETASLTSNHDNEAKELSTGKHDEEDDVFLHVHNELGEEVHGDGAGAVDAPGGRQPMRKRSWPANSSPLSLPRSFTRPLSSAEQRRAISKGSPAYKRSKREG